MTPNRTPRWLLVAAVLAVLLVPLVAVPAVFGAGPPGSPPGLAKAIAAQEAHNPQLLALPGVVGTAVGLGADAVPVVKVYTESGRPAGIPQSLDEVPVVVEAVGRIYAQVDPTARFPRPVPIGVSTGHPDITAGTIGARVTDGSRVFALSNNHVYANENRATVGDPVLQPGVYDGGAAPNDTIGTLHEYVPIRFDGSANRVDAAIALSDEDFLGNSTPSDGYGAPSSTIAAAVVNMQVIKYGRTTGLTSGRVDAVNASVNVGYDRGTALFTGQVVIKGTAGAFSAGGDSGSLIVTASGHNPVALLFAGSRTVTIGNPIGEVLDAFGVSVDASPPDTTTTTSPTTTTTTTTLPAEAISLSVTTYKVDLVRYADLTWSEATSGNVDVWRNNQKIATTTNDGFYTDNTQSTRIKNATYKVCNEGTSTCSNSVKVRW